MTDIVERARQVVRCRGAYSSMEVARLLGQLADEIERLIKLWNDYRIAHASVARDNERLEADNERLQAELVAANVRAGKYSAGCEQCERVEAENDMLRSLIIDAPTKEERDEIFERRFGRALEQSVTWQGDLWPIGTDGQQELK